MKINTLQNLIVILIISLFAIFPTNAQWDGSSTSKNAIWRHGDVGIGLSDEPTLLEKLHINGAIKLGTTTNTNAGTIRWTGSDFEGRTSTSWLSLTGFGGKSGNNIYNTNTGNVGIGTSNPLYNLHIASLNGANLVLEENLLNGGGGNILGQIIARSIDFNGVNTGIIKFEPDGIWSQGSYPTRITFWTASGSGGYPAGEWMRITNNGLVGIGTTNPTHKLSVNGTIRAKEIIVNTGWSDFVFEDDYDLMTLSELEIFIKQNGHLPEIPTTAEIEADGVELGNMQSKLLLKIEELTLYMIELKKENDSLAKQLEKVKESISH